jgi:hypothetical protein
MFAFAFALTAWQAKAETAAPPAIDAVSSPRAPGDTTPRPAPSPPDSARGRVVFTGPSATGFIMLMMADSQAVRLAGYPKNILRQVSRKEIVVFGKRYGPGPFRWPLQMVDSFFVRAVGGRPALDGILRREPGGDALELPDGRRLPIKRLPEWVAHANGMRVWIVEPLDAPLTAGVIDPNKQYQFKH